MNFKINSDKLCTNDYCEVRIIKRTIAPEDLLVAKIYRDPYSHNYLEEKAILELLSEPPNNENILKLKSTDNIHIVDEDFGPNPRFLIFEYHKHQNLVEYLIEGVSNIDEKIVKYIGYKLINAIKVMRDKKICHKKLDIENIMLDENFKPIIIHFSEALRDVSEDDKFHEDLQGLIKILAKLLSNGKLSNFGQKKINNKRQFIIIDNQNQPRGPNKFWASLVNPVSKEFQDFFKLIIRNQTLDLNILLNHDWLKGINDDKDVDNDMKKYFSKIYDYIQMNKSEIKFNYSNAILKEDDCKENNSLFDGNMRAESEQNISELFSNLVIYETKFEPKGILFDYLLIELTNFDSDSSFFNKFMKKLYCHFQQNEEINGFNIKSEFKKEESFLSFDLNIEKNVENNEIIDNKEFIDEDYIIPDDINDENNDNNDDDSLIIRLELIKYNNDNIKDFSLKNFYLLFNYKSGEISLFYYFVKIIKEKSKNILNGFFPNNNK